MLATLLTVLGIGLLLFLHEGGHYLAARAAGVRVDVFSLGFGPRLLGFKKGATDYRISLIPLGGYVRMAGEEASDAPEGLLSKSVGWRFLIFAGGIMANFLIAFLVIPILFAVGVPLEAPLVGPVEPGSAAWEAGIHEGDRVLAANGDKLFAFRHFTAAVALNEKGTPLLLELESVEGNRRSVSILPLYDEEAGFARVGIGLPEKLVLHPAGSPVVAGFATEDKITAIDGISVVGRPAISRLLLSQATRAQRAIQLTLQPANSVAQSLAVEPTPVVFSETPPLQIGVFAQANVVHANLSPTILPFDVGDQLHLVNGSPVGTLDDIAEALLSENDTVLRYGNPAKDFVFPKSYTPESLFAELALTHSPGLSISVRLGSPAFEAGLRDGDTILRANDHPVYSLGDLRNIIEAQEPDTSLLFSVRRDEKTFTVSLTPKPAQAIHYGIAREVLEETVRANGPVQALTLGLGEANRMGTEVVRTLSQVLGGGIDSRNLGGIMTIGVITHSFAEQGWIPLLFFLCMISIHLGVLNLLPIPGLDGGHLMFLLYEKLRGKPLSAEAQGIINLAGFLLVISMVVFVTSLDIQRFFS